MIQFAFMILAAPLAMLSFFRWQLGLYGLLLFLPVSGAISLWLKPTSLSVFGPLLKDLLFVMPLYGGFFLFGLGQLRGARIPMPIVLSLTLLTLLALVQSANPSLFNIFVALIGLKVWLMYIPLIVISAAWLTSFDRLLFTLRLLSVVTLVPAGIGLLQWAMSATIGYQATMTMFYGAAARAATQNFGGFTYGGDLYRIPSTFSFVSQYFSFLLAMVVPAMTVALADPSPRWRKRGWIILGILVAAGFLSGARSAIAMLPLIIGLVFVIDARATGAIAAAIMLPVFLLTTLFIAGLDPLQVLGATSDLVVGYSRSIVVRGVLDSLQSYPLGLGTGMSTGPARYALTGDESLPLIESFFAKSVVEFGVPGLIVVTVLFVTVIWSVFIARKQLIHPLFRAFGATVLAYCILIAINSAKGAILDIDPTNVLYWFYIGLLMKLPFLESEILQRINRDRANRAAAAPQAPQVPQGQRPGLRPQPVRLVSG